MERFGEFCFMLIALAVTSIIGGFVFSTLWEWLLVPIFDFQKLRLIHAIGISSFIGYVKTNPMKKQDEDIDIKFVVKSVLKMVIYSLITIVIAWFVTLFY